MRPGLRLLATYSGYQWLTLKGHIPLGGSFVLLDAYNGFDSVQVVARPENDTVWSLVQSLWAKHDSVPAYALSDALREDLEYDDDATKLADMLQLTLRQDHRSVFSEIAG